MVLQYPDFDPVLLQLGPVSIRWYALAYVAGILLGWRYALNLILMMLSAPLVAAGAFLLAQSGRPQNP